MIDIGKWREWRIKMVGWLINVDPRFDEALQEIERRAVPLEHVPEQLKVLGHFLHAVLIGHTTGVAFEEVAAVADFNGWEAWRILASSQTSLVVGQKLTQLQRLLEPDFGYEEAEFHRRWLSWERTLETFRMQFGHVVTPDLRITIVRRRAPEPYTQTSPRIAGCYLW